MNLVLHRWPFEELCVPNTSRQLGMDWAMKQGGEVKTISHIDGNEPSSARPLTAKLQSTEIKSGVVLTIAAWFCSRIVVSAAWAAARNPFAFNTLQWVHSDSINYLGIAAHGRVFGRCGSPAFPDNALIRFWHLKWCGTAGWLPGYPWLMQVMHWSGISLPDAGVLISWIATAIAIFLVWFEWGRELPATRAFALLVLFGIFPGSVYNFAVFPTAIALACVVAAILAATRERFFTTALMMTLAGLCYPTAWFATVGLTGGLMLVALPLGWTAILKRALWGLAGLSSILILVIHDQIALGQAGAYFVLDSNAVDSLSKTVHQFYQIFVSRDTVEQTRMGRTWAPLYSVQVVIAIGISFASAGIAGRHWLRDRRDTSYVYPAMVGFVLILALIFTNNTWNRGVVLAAPCVVCFHRLPLPLLWAIILVVAVTSALISRFFFNGDFY
jgi:hypothetical protein